MTIVNLEVKKTVTKLITVGSYTDGWAITWDGDTITLPKAEGLIFMAELGKAGEEYTHEPITLQLK